MFCTILILHFDYFQDLNSCFAIWLFDPFASTNFESPFNSNCQFQFPSIACMLLYNLHCLNIHLLFPKNLEIEIFRKNISSFEFRHLQKIMLSIKPNHSQYFACVFASEKFICFQDGHQMVNENSTKICSMLTNKQYKWYPQQLVNHI